MRVELVPWPRESARRDALADAGRARLLLVAPDAAAPLVVDIIEDWVRLPASTRELDVRLRRLEAMTAANIPTVDRDHASV